MGISELVERAEPEDLLLDPKNPRLGRHLVESKPSQDKILTAMLHGWALEELAISFIESGFWTQEALVVVKEPLGGRKNCMIVVEGNRRLAALKLLQKARNGVDVPDKWKEIAKSGSATKFRKLEQVPYVLADSRKDVQAYLGFRHVSGIKEWQPAEKAEFIAHLIDDEKLTYRQVMRRIGSKTSTVRRNYISFRLLKQMEQGSDEISIRHVEERFSVLYLSLRTQGVQTYLSIDIQADPRTARRPVPKEKLKQLESFARWLFGDDENEPLVRDSRQVDKFGEILQSGQAMDYLHRSKNPTFETAYRYAGGDEAETAAHIERAADEVEGALATAHHHRRSKRLLVATERLAEDVWQLLQLFPEIRKDLLLEDD